MSVRDNRWAPIRITVGHPSYFWTASVKVCNAMYFLSLLESKGEDYLIWSDVHQDPAENQWKFSSQNPQNGGRDIWAIISFERDFGGKIKVILGCFFYRTKAKKKRWAKKNFGFCWLPYVYIGKCLKHLKKRILVIVAPPTDTLSVATKCIA